MEFSKDDLNKVRLKKDGRGIHELDLGINLVEVVEELKLLEDFHYGFFAWANTREGQIIARNKIIRYINFMYSMELTCIKNTISEYKPRKVECAIHAGFEYDPNNGKFEKEVEEMFDGKNKYVNRMIITFLRHQYSPRFSMITILLEKFYQGIGSLMDNPDTTPKDIMAWRETGEDLEQMMFNFMGGDESKPLTAALVTRIEEESLELRPENIAYKIKEMKDPLNGFDPYAKNK